MPLPLVQVVTRPRVRPIEPRDRVVHPDGSHPLYGARGREFGLQLLGLTVPYAVDLTSPKECEPNASFV